MQEVTLPVKPRSWASLLRSNDSPTLIKMQPALEANHQIISAVSTLPGKSTIDKKQAQTGCTEPASHGTLCVSSNDWVDRHGAVNVCEGISMVLIDCKADLVKILAQFNSLPSQPPSIYLDLEGRELGRSSRPSVLTLYVRPWKQVLLIDLLALGPGAFDVTPDLATMSLKGILESETVPKVLFDARSPSDALFGNFGISLNSVLEIQLMELRCRRGSKGFLSGLAKCVEMEPGFNDDYKAKWLSIKDNHRFLYNPQFGGNDALLDERPLAKNLQRSCAQNAVCLAQLWDSYRPRQNLRAMSGILSATRERIGASQKQEYVGQGRHMALGPW